MGEEMLYTLLFISVLHERDKRFELIGSIESRFEAVNYCLNNTLDYGSFIRCSTDSMAIASNPVSTQKS